MTVDQKFFSNTRLVHTRSFKWNPYPGPVSKPFKRTWREDSKEENSHEEKDSEDEEEDSLEDVNIDDLLDDLQNMEDDLEDVLDSLDEHKEKITSSQEGLLRRLIESIQSLLDTSTWTTVTPQPSLPTTGP